MTNNLGKRRKIEPIPEHVEEIASNTIGCALHVHTALGPGLLEKVYENCLIYELRDMGYSVESQVRLPINYKGLCMNNAYRLDILVENCLVIEIKTVEEISPIHQAQLLTYLKLSGYRLGLIFNFNTIHLKEGLKRVAN